MQKTDTHLLLYTVANVYPFFCIRRYNDMQRGKTSKVPLLFELAPSANISMHDDELSMQTIEASSFKDAIARVFSIK